MKRLFKAFLLGTTLIVLQPMEAEALPVAMLIPAFSTWFAALPIIMQGLVQIGIGLATTMLTNALFKPEMQSPSASMVIQSVTAGDTTPQTFILGRRATKGNLLAPEYSHGAEDPNDFDDDDLRYLTRIVDISDVPITALEHLVMDNKVIALDGITSNYGTAPSDPKFIKGSDRHFWVRFHDGTQTTPDTHLRNKYGSHPKRPWTADMICRRIAYAVLTFEFNQKVWDTGRPDVKFVVKGIKLYDPRKDSTAGGTGTHRFGTESTYEFTENPAVMVYNILRGITITPAATVGGVAYTAQVFGGGFAAEDLPYSVWATAMNACDAQVGTPARPRYTAGYEVRVGHPTLGGDTPLDVIDELLKTCSGTIVDRGGTVYIRVGAPELPVKFITDDDILRSRPQDLDPFPAIQSSHNAVQGMVIAESMKWEPKTLPLKIDTQAETDDGRPLVADVRLPAVYREAQGEDLIASWLKDERRFGRHNVTMPPECILHRPLQVYNWTSTYNSYTGKDFEIDRMGIDPRTLSVTLAMRERDSSDSAYDATKIVDNNNPNSDPDEAPAIVLLDWAAVPVDVTPAGDATVGRPGIRCSWKVVNNKVDRVAVRVRTSGSTDPFLIVSAEYSEGFILITEGLLRAQAYEVQGIPISAAQDTVGTAWTPVTTTGIKTPPGDVTIPGSGNGLVAASPTGFTASAVMRGAVFSWNENPEDDLLRYEIYEASANTAPTGATAPTFRLGAGTTSFGRMGLADGAQRWYWMRAVDGTGASPWVASTPTSITTGTSLGITTAMLQNLVNATSFAAGIEPIEIVGTLPTTGNFDGRQAYLTTDKKNYRHNGTAWIKEVDGADIKAASVTTTSIAAGAISTDQLAARAITAEKMIIQDRENLVPRWSFGDDLRGSHEANPTFLIASGGTGSNFWKTGWLVTGPTAMEVVKGAVATRVVERPEFYVACQPGESYWLDLHARTASGVWANGFSARIAFYAFDKSFISYGQYNNMENIGLDTTYRPFTAQIEAPQGAAYMAPEIALLGTLAAGVSAYVDRMVIRTANAANLLVDGTIEARKVTSQFMEAVQITADQIIGGRISADLMNVNEQLEFQPGGAISYGKDSYNDMDDGFWFGAPPANVDAPGFILTAGKGMGTAEEQTITISEDLIELVNPSIKTGLTTHVVSTYNSASGATPIIVPIADDEDIISVILTGGGGAGGQAGSSSMGGRGPSGGLTRIEIHGNNSLGQAVSAVVRQAAGGLGGLNASMSGYNGQSGANGAYGTGGIGATSDRNAGSGANYSSGGGGGYMPYRYANSVKGGGGGLAGAVETINQLNLRDLGMVSNRQLRITNLGLGGVRVSQPSGRSPGNGAAGFVRLTRIKKALTNFNILTAMNTDWTLLDRWVPTAVSAKNLAWVPEWDQVLLKYDNVGFVDTANRLPFLRLMIGADLVGTTIAAEYSHTGMAAGDAILPFGVIGNTMSFAATARLTGRLIFENMRRYDVSKAYRGRFRISTGSDTFYNVYDGIITGIPQRLDVSGMQVSWSNLAPFRAGMGAVEIWGRQRNQNSLMDLNPYRTTA